MQIRDCCRKAVAFIREKQFVLGTSDGSLRPSQLGLATAFSGISPTDALLVFPYLQGARSRFIMKSGFHAVFLVVPPNASLSPSWREYEAILTALYADHPVSTQSPRFALPTHCSLMSLLLLRVL